MRIFGYDNARRDLGPEGGSVVRILTLVLLLLLPAAPVRAGETARMLDLAARAMREARAATHYLRTENTGPALLALVRARRAWKDLRGAFESRVPDVFDGNPAFPGVFAAVEGRLAAAMEALRAKDPKAAREAAEEAIAAWRRARRASHIVLFPDCVEEANAAVDRLWRWRREEPDLGDPAVRREILDQVAVARYLYARCREQAPEDLRGGEEFARLFDGALKSLATMPEAVEAGETLRFVNILRELRSFDRLIRFRYG